jgi:diguanylate cyclase (GGDEF)-like protein/PAS domain S-box-containing protein
MAARNNTSLSLSSEGASNRELLEAWSKMHRPLLEILLDAFCVVDQNNQVLDFNDAFSELCGESFRKILKIGNFCELLKTEQCPDKCPARQVMETEGSIRLDEIAGTSKTYPTLHMIIAAVPIRGTDGAVLGALVTIRNVSAEAELQKKYGERTEASVTDGLTKLYNKKYAEDYLLNLVKTSIRDKKFFSVAMLDIDHFKKVNDTYGHQAGDHVLSTVAQLVKAEGRETDVFGRFGGEEFIAILGHTDPRGACVFAERLRKRIDVTAFTFDGKKIPVTISIGTATFREEWHLGASAEKGLKEVVGRADTALYFAKANGRNRVCQFETLPSPETDAKAGATPKETDKG